ncbi:MAG: hypothetical protein II344_04185 [Bacteroidales bacterium]|nr:hypothetical protein [Bacteroidales bacterium]
MAVDPLPKQQALILSALENKANVKSFVFDQSLEAFNMLKETLREISSDLNDLISENITDKRIRLEYRDRGKFEAELKFADDVLVFSMHTDVFQFDRDHSIWKNQYAKESPFNTYCGVISVYNFLSDSLKYNRAEDLGYLVARLFINKDKKFFIEGKRQQRSKISSFGKTDLTKEELISFVESAMLYSLSFDLLVPPFDLVKVASVEQINAKIESTQMRTGKRMGFKYNSDDVLDED